MYKCYNWLDDLPCQDEWGASECKSLKNNGECCDKEVMENCIWTCGLCNKQSVNYSKSPLQGGTVKKGQGLKLTTDTIS